MSRRDEREDRDERDYETLLVQCQSSFVREMFVVIGAPDGGADAHARIAG